ncbi:MAG: hypothetical protein QW547_02385 [Candidatus Bathyarchaeia archaeon]
MAWGWRGRKGSWIGPWPGRGPFSYLPPWQRPGWTFGRGWCWYYLYSPWVVRRLLRAWRVYPPFTPPQSPEGELATLEDYKKELEEEKASIEQEIRDVEARIRELKGLAKEGGS